MVFSVRDHLTPHPVLCYHAQLLHRSKGTCRMQMQILCCLLNVHHVRARWSKLMRAPVTVGEGMEKVERKKDERRGPCGCEEEVNVATEHDNLEGAKRDEL